MNSEGRVRIGEKDIVIVASADENYAVPLGVAFVSVLNNSDSADSLRFFVIDGGISQKKKVEMRQEIESRGACLEFLRVDDGLYSGVPVKAHVSVPAYYRISIPDLFDDSVKRAVYLDCDLVARSDIGELWRMDLEGKHLGAVENLSNHTYRASGLRQMDYFNSGVMVLDLERWREDDIPERVRRFKREHPERISTNDQCALNGVLSQSWKRLPLHWNQQSGIYRMTSQLEHFSEKEVERALWDPSVVHYVGWSKPWTQGCFHPLEGEYRRNLADTVWAEEGLQPSTRQADWSISLLKKRWRQRRWQRKYREQGVDLYPRHGPPAGG